MVILLRVDDRLIHGQVAVSWTGQLHPDVIAGCPCGRKLLGIMPDLETIPGNGECIIPLGRFNSDLLSLLNNPLNAYYKNDNRPSICEKCSIRNECDGGCRASHSYPMKLQERCNALKTLFRFVLTLNNIYE